MHNKIQDAIYDYFGDYDALEHAHQVRVWERYGLVWITEPTVIEPGARRVEIIYERGYGWRAAS